MDFHHRTLDLVGQRDLRLDRERGAVAARIAAAAGIALPAAVAEWYCVPEAAPLWKSFCRGDTPIIRRLEGAPQEVWRGRAVRDDVTREVWMVPAIYHDLRGWVTSPVLPLMSEIYSTWWWGVVLDGTPDPRVAMCWYDEGDTWDYCGASFSEYVFSILFDNPLYGYDEDGFRREVSLGGHLGSELRRLLLKEFRVGPTTREFPPGGFTERFWESGQRFSFQNIDLGGAQRYSSWRLWSSSNAGFTNLVDRLSRILPEFTGLTPGKEQVQIRAGATSANPEPDCDREDIPF